MKKITGLVVVMAGLGMGLYAGPFKAKKPVSAHTVSEDKAEGISFFKGTWGEALTASREQNKLIFLDAYASWCGPCKLMAKNTFTKKEAGDFFNANFINVKMDMEKHSDGPRLSNKFKLRAYPTLYFINGDEEIVHQALGMHKAKELIELGKNALKLK